jgi:hypothetical protein
MAVVVGRPVGLNDRVWLAVLRRVSWDEGVS